MRLLLLTACLVPVGCNLGGDVELRDSGVGDGSTGDADSGIEDGGDGGADAADDVDAGPGPVTLVATEAAFVLDRMCDIDGDGQADNALADLGEPSASLLASILSTGIAATVSSGSRWVLHMPRVDDPETPHDPLLTITSFSGKDEESCLGTPPPDHEEDDFTGHEPFCSTVEHLDGCGEPVSVSDEARIDRGELSAEGWDIALGTDNPTTVRGARLEGTVAPGTVAAEADACGYFAASELGDVRSPGEFGDLSLLERFLAGGAAAGIPAVDGLEIDVDIDGDGLESFVVDDEHRVVSCVDGDGGVIAEPGCWRDDRIADGFSLTLRASFVSAVYMGREEIWNERECGTILSSLERCHDRGCVNGRTNRVCPDQAALLDALLDCEDERCSAECALPPVACRACAQAECGDELAACLDAPVCCPEPPATSAWDPT